MRYFYCVLGGHDDSGYKLYSFTMQLSTFPTMKECIRYKDIKFNNPTIVSISEMSENDFKTFISAIKFSDISSSSI